MVGSSLSQETCDMDLHTGNKVIFVAGWVMPYLFFDILLQKYLFSVIWSPLENNLHFKPTLSTLWNGHYVHRQNSAAILEQCWSFYIMKYLVKPVFISSYLFEIKVLVKLLYSSEKGRVWRKIISNLSYHFHMTRLVISHKNELYDKNLSPYFYDYWSRTPYSCNKRLSFRTKQITNMDMLFVNLRLKPYKVSIYFRFI